MLMQVMTVPLIGYYFDYWYLDFDVQEYQYSEDLDNFFGEYDLPLERILFDLEQFQYNHYILKDRNWLAFDFVDPLY